VYATRVTAHDRRFALMDKSILLVKTSSLGDVIHALPAISDMQSAAAGGRVDWVVEEPLGNDGLHPAT
jgi:heptosyltransferase-1